MHLQLLLEEEREDAVVHHDVLTKRRVWAEEPHFAASKCVKGAGKKTGNEPNENAEQLSHARSKIEELGRQLQESQERALIAMHQVDDYTKAAESCDGLEKKLVALRFVASSAQNVLGPSSLAL